MTKQTKVVTIGVPADYLIHSPQGMDLKWIRKVLHESDLLKLNKYDIMLNMYFDIHHEGKQPQYISKAIRLPEEDYNRLKEFSTKTGMTMKVLTHMLLSIALNEEKGE